MFTIYQLSQLQISIYINAKKTPQETTFQKKIANYNKEMQSQIISEYLLQVLELYVNTFATSNKKKTLKKPIMTTVIAYIFRILMAHKEWPDLSIRQEKVNKLFDLLSQIRHTKVTDNQILTSVSIMHFENPKTL